MYILFAWSQYQCEGGVDDHHGTYATPDEAIAAFSSHEAAWPGEAWIGHLATFDGSAFVKVLWLCKENGVTVTEDPTYD